MGSDLEFHKSARSRRWVIFFIGSLVCVAVLWLLPLWQNGRKSTLLPKIFPKLKNPGQQASFDGKAKDEGFVEQKNPVGQEDPKAQYQAASSLLHEEQFLGHHAHEKMVDIQLLGKNFRVRSSRITPSEKYSGLNNLDLSSCMTDPTDYFDFLGRAMDFELSGDFGAAIQDYTKAIALNPNDVSTYNKRGLAYRMMGDFGHALEDYSKAIEIGGAKNIDRQQSDLFAVSKYNIFIQEMGKFSIGDVYFNRSYVRLKLGDDQGVVEDATVAIQLNGNNDGAYLNRANAYDYLGEFAKALSDYQTALNLKPDNPNIYLERGIALAGQGRKEEALRDYKQALALAPPDWDDRSKVEKLMQTQLNQNK